MPSTQRPLCHDRNQIPQRSEMTRCAQLYLQLGQRAADGTVAIGDIIIVRHADDSLTGYLEVLARAKQELTDPRLSF
jgi:hypothetical protein